MKRFQDRQGDLWYTLCVVGGVAALVGFGIACLGFHLLGPQGGWMQHAPVVVPLAAAFASLLVASFFWWRWMSGPSAFDVRLGARTGAVISTLAHTLTWWLVTVLYALTNTDHVATDWGLRLPVVGLLALPLASLLLLGWLTALLGAVIGALFVLLQHQLHGREAGSTA